jgi:hypothetical protein
MSRETSPGEQPEDQNFSTLDEFLNFLTVEGVEPLSSDFIRKQLEEHGVAIVTRDFCDGIRISKMKNNKGESVYRIWVTNLLDDEQPEHPLVKKIKLKEIEI